MRRALIYLQRSFLLLKYYRRIQRYTVIFSLIVCFRLLLLQKIMHAVNKLGCKNHSYIVRRNTHTQREQGKHYCCEIRNNGNIKVQKWKVKWWKKLFRELLLFWTIGLDILDFSYSSISLKQLLIRYERLKLHV
jgi:hypothetical protein